MARSGLALCLVLVALLAGGAAARAAGPATQDVNGDGLSDVLVMVPQVPASKRPQVPTVVFGTNSGATIQLSAIGSAGFTIVGAGRSPSATIVGDVNGDGFADVAVSNTDSQRPAGVWLVFGSHDVTSVDVQDLGARGIRLDVAGGSGTVFRVASAGDVNGDGFADLWVQRDTTRSFFEPASVANILFGGPALIAGLVPPSSQFVIKIPGSQDQAAVGDHNGDGRGDIVLGREGYRDCYGDYCAGQAELVWGPPSGTTLNLGGLDSRGQRVCGPGYILQFGRRVAAGGDIDGDGRGDVLISGIGDTLALLDASGARCGRGGWRPTGKVWQLRNTEMVASAGDTNADGHGDLVAVVGVDIGDGTFAPLRAYLLYGSDRTSLPRFSSRGVAHRLPARQGRKYITNGGTRRAFCELTDLGDFNGDGRNDLLAETSMTSGSRCDRYDVVLGSASMSPVNLQQPDPRIVPLR